MQVSVIGAGYVGLVTAACFADVGNVVLCVDIDAQKIKRLKRSEIPIHEPGLEQLVERNTVAGRLRFSTSYDDAVAHAALILIAVGTPSGE
ncbi:MAG TPA: 3-hydroxyacyl-CoA dehydrogenase NAD-binding domain-containing protein, partial [Burkholderiaceae bacterium]|nr:3-hydroxyacyl-CoA dehydrogenase NAD-binding domain-containing protein [Burkholderiaceae bacterium]